MTNGEDKEVGLRMHQVPAQISLPVSRLSSRSSVFISLKNAGSVTLIKSDLASPESARYLSQSKAGVSAFNCARVSLCFSL